MNTFATPFVYASKPSRMSNCTRFLVTDVRSGHGRMRADGIVFQQQSVSVTHTASGQSDSFRIAQMRERISTDREPSDDMQLCMSCLYFHPQADTTCAEASDYVRDTMPVSACVQGKILYAQICTPGRCFARTLVPCTDATHRHVYESSVRSARIRARTRISAPY